MELDLLFVCEGLQISVGIKIKAKKGKLEVTPANELVLSGDKSEVLARSSITQVAFKFSSLDPGAVTVKMNGKKWYVAFEPPMKTSAFGAIGGMVAGMEHAQREDVKAARAKREEFRALVEKAQTATW